MTAPRPRDERGDTLVEVLIAVTIISIAFAALLGSLIESIQGSTTHRSLTTVDTVLKSYAESARYQVALRPVSPQFKECATSYTLVGSPSPGAGPAGTMTTLLGSGFAPSSPVTVVVGNTPVSGVTSPWSAAGTPTTDAVGDVSVTFPIPAGLATTPATSYPVTVTDGAGDTATSTGGLLVTSTALPTVTIPPVQSYQVTMSSLGWWNGTTFDPSTGTCTAADTTGTQSLTFTATAPDGTTDHLSIIVTNPSGAIPSLAGPSSATFIVGVASSVQLVAAAHPQPTFSLATGSTLPGGLSLSSAGLLSGTPAAGTAGAHNVSITTSNSAGAKTQSFSVYVDQPPSFTSATQATFVVGTAGTFTAAASGYPAATYAVTSGTLPTGLSLDPASGIISGTPSGPPSTSTVTLTAANGVNPNATQALTITVSTAPKITSAASATFTVGQAGSFTMAASGSPTPTFSEVGTLPRGVTLSAATGVLAGTPAAGTAGSYPLTVTATNAGGSDQQAFTLTVQQTPAITSPSTATFTAGTAGAFSASATGYPVPTWTEAGPLPSGLSFSSAGVLSGTPGALAGGSYPVTLTATNAAGSATQALTVVVKQTSSFTSANTATFKVGTAGSFTVTAAGVPAPTITESGALPTGVTFTGATATLAGTPAAGTGGSYPITFTATNGVGSPATQSFTLVVNQAPAFTSGTAATFTVGVAGSSTPTVTGYPASTFSEAGTLPNGLTFNAANGAITGIPAAGTAGTYPVTVTASNGVSPAATLSLTITVTQVPAFTSASTTTFTAGSVGSFTVTASGSPAPTFSETGALPSGVTLNATTGVLSGTPAATAGGTYNLTLTATNSAGSASQTFTLIVNQKPAITSGSSATFGAGSSNTFTVTATGYPAPTFTEFGTLPTGVTFNPATGALSGTPTGGGTYSLSFTATNAAGSATQSFTLTINQAPAITSSSTATFTLNQYGSFAVTASGYPTPTFSQSSTLPAGLSFSSAGVLSGTATVAGTYALSVTASNGVSPAATQTLTVVVQQAPMFTSAAATSFTPGTASSFTVTAVGPPTPSVTLTAGTLPTGVSYNPSTGVLSGTTSVAGTYPLTFSATNALGTTTQAFTLTVGQAPSISPASGTLQNKNSTLVITATGNPTPTMTVSGLPTGVTATGSGTSTITLSESGSPASGTSQLTFTARNAVSTTTLTYTLTVK